MIKKCFSLFFIFFNFLTINAELPLIKTKTIQLSVISLILPFIFLFLIINFLTSLTLKNSIKTSLLMFLGFIIINPVLTFLFSKLNNIFKLDMFLKYLADSGKAGNLYLITFLYFSITIIFSLILSVIPFLIFMWKNKSHDKKKDFILIFIATILYVQTICFVTIYNMSYQFRQLHPGKVYMTAKL